MQIPILFEDDDILIINKPAGITVNNSDTTQHEATLQDWAVEYLQLEVSKGENVSKVSNGTLNAISETYDSEKTFYDRGGIVHRLDKETSGVMILAKNPTAFQALQKQFKERMVKKTYLALVHGKVTPASGEINIPVGRLPWNRRQFGVVAGGRESITFYEVKQLYRTKDARKEILSLVELEPKTGRTHQIRVHMKYLNHPLFADFLYAGRKTSAADRKILSRVFLHAAKISFLHPVTNDPVSFESPLMPELQNVIDNYVVTVLS